MIYLIRRKGSKASKYIIDNSEVKEYKGKKAKILVNYGVTSKKLESFYKSYPKAKQIPTINRLAGRNKYNVIKIAEKNKITVPKSFLEIPNSERITTFIEKKFHSIGGIGIKEATSKRKREDKYYQKRVIDRVCELRVHMFLWSKTPIVQKRYGDANTIAWNFRNGGHFSSVKDYTSKSIYTEAVSTTKKMLELLNMGFGAADFIIDNKGKLYFLEMNSSPGFQENLTGKEYIKAFDQLITCPIEKLLKICF